RPGDPPVDPVADLLKARDVGRRRECADPLKGVGDTLLHLRRFELGEELRSLRELLLHEVGVVLHGALRRLRRGSRALVKLVQVGGGRFHRRELHREEPGRALVGGGLFRVALRPSIFGQDECLGSRSTEPFELGDRARELELKLALVSDDRGGLLAECGVLSLGVFDRLLDLHSRIGERVERSGKERDRVVPGALDESEHFLHLPISVRSLSACRPKSSVSTSAALSVSSSAASSSTCGAARPDPNSLSATISATRATRPSSPSAAASMRPMSSRCVASSRSPASRRALSEPSAYSFC